MAEVSTNVLCILEHKQQRTYQIFHEAHNLNDEPPTLAVNIILYALISDKLPPQVVYCPSDTRIVDNTNHLVTVHWTEPVFSDQLGILNITQTHRIGMLLYTVENINYKLETFLIQRSNIMCVERLLRNFLIIILNTFKFFWFHIYQ